MDKATVNSLFTIPHEVNSKIDKIESTLHQAIYQFRDLVIEFKEMCMQTESMKKQVSMQKEECESKCCVGSEELKKVIEAKEHIIQDIGAALTKLYETKNFNFPEEVYRVLFGGRKPLDNVATTKAEIQFDVINIQETSLLSPKKEPPESMSLEEDVSLTEIEGTPTGRLSPIIQSKRMKPSVPNDTALRDKQKCLLTWITPDKTMNRTPSSTTANRIKGNGRQRQQRLPFSRKKQSTVVDLTTTPQFSKGRHSQAEDLLEVKQEVIEIDDTVMPSPTSVPTIPPVYILSSKESPQKLKKPLSLKRAKTRSPASDCKENEPEDVSVSKPEGFVSPQKNKTKSPHQVDESISLLRALLSNVEEKTEDKQCNSPVKRPLEGNINIVNMPCSNESISILNREAKLKVKILDENIESTKSQILVPLYKEPTVRKKAEKRALPGWSCDSCEKFYGELYKDDPEMLAKKMDECSKHRGKNNPLRPKTPPGFWNPRWDCPDDTEEFNRLNNAG